MHNVGNQNKEW